MKKKLALLAALAMAMTMFAACGDADDSSSTAPATDDTSSVATDDTSSEEESSEEVSSEEESSEEESSEESSEPEEVEFNGTIMTDGEYPGDWSSPNFVIDNDGNTVYFVDIAYLEPYAETGCTVTVEYSIEKMMDMKTLEESYYPYYLLAPFNAADWTKIYPEGTEDNPYTSGLPEELDARVEISGALKEDFTGDYFMQSDGTIVWCDKEGVWPEGPVVFNLTAAGVQHLIDHQGEGDDGSLWGGMGFQTYGINVLSVTLSDIAE